MRRGDGLTLFAQVDLGIHLTVYQLQKPTVLSLLCHSAIILPFQISPRVRRRRKPASV